MSEKNKALVCHWVEELDKGHLEIFDELCTPDYVCHLPGNPEPLNRNQHKEFAGSLLAAFPDFHHTIEDLIAEGDKVVIRCTNRATHKGDLMGISATGNKVAYGTIVIIRIVEGKIVEASAEADLMGLMQQVGAIAPPGKS